MKFAWISVGFIILSGCAFKPTASHPMNDAVKLASDSSDGFVHAEVKPSEDAFRYETSLSWKSVPQALSLIVRRKRLGDIDSGYSQDLITLGPTDTSFVDLEARHNTKYKYEIVGVFADGVTVISNVEIQTPLDFVFSGVSDGISLIPDNINRIIFLKNAILRTNGSNLELSANEIISNNATIETLPAFFPPAEPFANGRDAGKITIRAQRGKGVLTIVSRGGEGGRGTPGDRGAPGAAGNKGADATVGFGEMECPMSQIPNPHCHQFPICKSEATDGAKGGEGSKGGPGGPGMKGGSAGDIDIRITEESPLTILPRIEPGKGGIGGNGGDGGGGGPGGSPGISIDRCSYRAHTGPIGPSGPRGEQGPRGMPGDVLSYCIQNGTYSFGQCIGT